MAEKRETKGQLVKKQIKWKRVKKKSKEKEEEWEKEEEEDEDEDEEERSKKKIKIKIDHKNEAPIIEDQEKKN